MEDILVIHGNITPTVHRLEKLAKEREEREKKELEERRERERQEREAKDLAWKKAHPVLDKFTYISSWNYDTYSWPGDYVGISFYEWSNINSNPIKFDYSIAFFKFLDKCGIMPTEADVAKIKRKSGCHIVCKPGCNELIVGETYEEMCNSFNSAKTLAKVLAVVPEVPKERNINSNILIDGKKDVPALAKVPRVLNCVVYDSPVDYC